MRIIIAVASLLLFVSSQVGASPKPLSDNWFNGPSESDQLQTVHVRMHRVIKSVHRGHRHGPHAPRHRSATPVYGSGGGGGDIWQIMRETAVREQLWREFNEWLARQAPAR